MSSPTARRRQRSTRLTVATALLTIAAVLVTAAIPTGQAVLSVIAGIAAVLLGTAATRITYSELIQSRRDAQQDRSALAKKYAEQAAQRAAENAAFATVMRTRLSTTEQSLHELETALGAAQKRAAEATRKFNTEARRAELAGERMTHSVGAALAGAVMVLIALGLERACRVRSEDREP